MAAAVRDIVMVGISKKMAAKRHGVPRGTLQRHVKNAEKGLGVEKRLGRHCVLSPEQEVQLATKLIDMEARLYGLTTQDVRKLVFQFCEMNHVKHPFSQEKRMAGKKWLRAFFQRHKDLSVRLPERTSISRAIGFNRPKVDLFFSVLGSTLFKADGSRHVPPENIYNVDETGFTICQKSQRIVGKKGKKSIGIISSAEKGKNVTVVCCVSAAGNYVPPMFVFPRVRVRPDFLDRGPTGSVAGANKSGWITEALFEECCEHFVTYVQPMSRSQPTLLLADGHCSHINNLSLIQKARDNNVILLIFPSHCTHKLQPLDVAIFKSLKWHYDKELSLWLRNHPGRSLTERDIPELFKLAYGRAATSANAASGFSKTGIHPFNPQVFSDEDFMGSLVTDVSDADEAGTAHCSGIKTADAEAVSTHETVIEQTAILTCNSMDVVASTNDTAGENEQVGSSAETSQFGGVTVTDVPDPGEAESAHFSGITTADAEAVSTDETVIEKTAILTCNSADVASTNYTDQNDQVDSSAEASHIGADFPDPDGITTTGTNCLDDSTVTNSQPRTASFEDIMPTPKAPCRSTSSRKRKALHATIATSSPFKETLKKAKEDKQNKEHAMKRKQLQKTNKKNTVQRRASSKVAARKKTPICQSSAQATTHITDNEPELNNIDRTLCNFCEIAYCDSSVAWFKCKRCSTWVCGDCAAIGRSKTAFVCSNCK